MGRRCHQGNGDDWDWSCVCIIKLLGLTVCTLLPRKGGAYNHVRALKPGPYNLLWNIRIKKDLKDELIRWSF